MGLVKFLEAIKKTIAEKTNNTDDLIFVSEEGKESVKANGKFYDFVPSNDNTPHQVLTTNQNGELVWEDKLCYEQELGDGNKQTTINDHVFTFCIDDTVTHDTYNTELISYNLTDLIRSSEFLLNQYYGKLNENKKYCVKINNILYEDVYIKKYKIDYSSAVYFISDNKDITKFTDEYIKDSIYGGIVLTNATELVNVYNNSNFVISVYNDNNQNCYIFANCKSSITLNNVLLYDISDPQYKNIKQENLITFTSDNGQRTNVNFNDNTNPEEYAFMIPITDNNQINKLVDSFNKLVFCDRVSLKINDISYNDLYVNTDFVNVYNTNSVGGITKVLILSDKDISNQRISNKFIGNNMLGMGFKDPSQMCENLYIEVIYVSSDYNNIEQILIIVGGKLINDNENLSNITCTLFANYDSVDEEKSYIKKIDKKFIDGFPENNKPYQVLVDNEGNKPIWQDQLCYENVTPTQQLFSENVTFKYNDWPGCANNQLNVKPLTNNIYPDDTITKIVIDGLSYSNLYQKKSYDGELYSTTRYEFLLVSDSPKILDFPDDLNINNTTDSDSSEDNEHSYMGPYFVLSKYTIDHLCNNICLLFIRICVGDNATNNYLTCVIYDKNYNSAEDSYNKNVSVYYNKTTLKTIDPKFIDSSIINRLLPTGSKNGQILTNVNNHIVWQDADLSGGSYDDSKLKAELNNKLDKPATDGQPYQVLCMNSSGKLDWLSPATEEQVVSMISNYIVLPKKPYVCDVTLYDSNGNIIATVYKREILPSKFKDYINANFDGELYINTAPLSRTGSDIIIYKSGMPLSSDNIDNSNGIHPSYHYNASVNGLTVGIKDNLYEINQMFPAQKTGFISDCIALRPSSTTSNNSNLFSVSVCFDMVFATNGSKVPDGQWMEICPIIDADFIRNIRPYTSLTNYMIMLTFKRY